jgi:hypothetical protein
MLEEFSASVEGHDEIELVSGHEGEAKRNQKWMIHIL